MAALCVSTVVSKAGYIGLLRPVDKVLLRRDRFTLLVLKRFLSALMGTLPLAMVTPLQAAVIDVEVTGYWQNGALVRPLVGGVEVILMTSGGPIFTAQLDDFTGHYQFASVNAGDDTFEICFTSKNTIATVVDANANEHLWCSSAMYSAASNQVLQVVVAAPEAAPFSILDAVSHGFYFVENSPGFQVVPSTAPIPLKLNYVVYPGSGTHFLAGNDPPLVGPFISIAAGNEYNWDVILHEVAHFVDYINGIAPNTPGGVHFWSVPNTGNNCFDWSNNSCQQVRQPPLDKQAGTRLAFSEGFASFFSILAQARLIQFKSQGDAWIGIGDVPNTGDTSINGVDIQDFKVHKSYGEDEESAVARILWNLVSDGGLLPSGAGGMGTVPFDNLLFEVITNNIETLYEFFQHFSVSVAPEWPEATLNPPLNNNQLLNYYGDKFESNHVAAGGDSKHAQVGREPLEGLLTDPKPTFKWGANGSGGNVAPGIALFQYLPSYFNDEFVVRFLDADWNDLPLTSGIIPGNAQTGIGGQWTPTDAEWNNLINGQHLIRWLVESRSKDTAPAAAAYYRSAAKTLGGADVALVIDDTGSMADEIGAVKQVLTNVLGSFANKPGTKPVIEVMTFKDDWHRDIVSDDLLAVQGAVGGIVAFDGGECREASWQALWDAQKDLKKPALAPTKPRIMLATDASPYEGYSLDVFIKSFQSFGYAVDVLLLNYCTEGGTGGGNSGASIDPQQPGLPAKPLPANLAGEIRKARAEKRARLARVAPRPQPVWVAQETEAPSAETKALPPGAVTTPSPPPENPSDGSPLTIDSLDYLGGDFAINQEPAFVAFKRLADATGGTFSWLYEPGPQDLTPFSNVFHNILLSYYEPTVISSEPRHAPAGSRVMLELQGGGTSFTPTSTVAFSGGGITVESVEVLSPKRLRALLWIDPAAQVGFRDVVVTSLLGGELQQATGKGVLEIRAVAVTPIITSVHPGLLHLGQSVTVYVTGAGTNFDSVGQPTTSLLSFADFSWQFGVGFWDDVPTITVDSITVHDTNYLTAQITVSNTADSNLWYEARVKTGGQTIYQEVQGTMILSDAPVDLEVPALLSTTPDSVERGSVVSLGVVGEHTSFAQGVTTVALSRSDVSVGAVTVQDETHLTVEVTVAADAELGYRSLHVSGATDGPTIHLSDAFRVEAPVSAVPALSPVGFTALGFLLTVACSALLRRRVR